MHRSADIKRIHRALLAARVKFVRKQQAALAPFASKKNQTEFAGTGRGKVPKVPLITPKTHVVDATLRPYQIVGVNWIIKQYSMGIGGILGDEMGLGKTIQTLAFFSALNKAGLPGPHLVITPLAVLLNWINEIRKFTPHLTVCKVGACD